MKNALLGGLKGWSLNTGGPKERFVCMYKYVMEIQLYFDVTHSKVLNQ